MSDQVRILVVGAGCFGVSTALHLLRDPDRKYTVKLIDRASILPAPDAASTDLNKIVRTSYADAWYSRFAQEAIAEWRTDETFRDVYHECGVVVLGGTSGSELYSGSAYQNDVIIGSDIATFSDQASAKDFFPADANLGNEIKEGYINRENGWANATRGVARALDAVRALGGQVMTGQDVERIKLDDNRRATGVFLRSGEEHTADYTVIATGSWTPSITSFTGMGANGLLATGQCIATIQLSPDQARTYKYCPIVLDFATGFYVFPPNEDDIMKMACHHIGYINLQPLPITDTTEPSTTPELVSTPRTIVSHPETGHAIPRVMANKLRLGLQGIYPELADVPFSGTRMCWYCETSNTDWLIDHHPDYPGLVFATGGSGHAYKFLPVVGSLVKARLEGKLDVDLAKRFAFRQDGFSHSDPSRIGHLQPIILREEDLVVQTVSLDLGMLQQTRKYPS